MTSPSKEVSKRYYEKNRERILAKQREYYERRKDYIKAKRLAYYHKNRKAILEGRKQEKVRKRKNASQRRWRRKQKNNLLKIIGDECVICHSKERLVFHEIYGKPHEYVNSSKKTEYILRHKEDFVTMCFKCHGALHNLAKKENVDIKHFVELLLKLMEQ